MSSRLTTSREHRCEGCQHVWRTFGVELPSQCPGCYRLDWNRERETEERFLEDRVQSLELFTKHLQKQILMLLPKKEAPPV